MTHSVHIVFYKHLTSWLLYGHLEDIHREFFIQKASDCEKTLVHEDVKNDIDTHNQSANSKNMWDYDVQMDMLPSYIRPSLANKILTIGQTVIMFGNDPRQKKGNFMKKIYLNCFPEYYFVINFPSCFSLRDYNIIM